MNCLSLKFRKSQSSLPSTDVIDHSTLINIGTRSHDEIDSYLAELDEIKNASSDNTILSYLNENIVIDHNDLLNNGMKTHSQLDAIALEVEESRGGYGKLGARLDDIELELTGLIENSDIYQEVVEARGTFSDLDTRFLSIESVLDNYNLDLTSLSQTLHEKVRVQYDGQTKINLRKGSYTVGTNTLMVFLNGQYQHKNLDYVEVSPTQIKFTDGYLHTGDLITLHVSGYTDEVYSELEEARGTHSSIAMRLQGLESLINSGTLDMSNISATLHESITIDTDGQRKVVLTVGEYAVGSDTLLVFRNGQYQHPNIDYVELTTSEILFAEEYLFAGDVITVHVAGGGMSETSEEVVEARGGFTTLNDRLNFIESNGGGGGGSGLIGGGDVASPLHEEVEVVFDGQVLIDITTGAYEVGSNTLMVFKNGSYQISGVDYTELNPAQIQFKDSYLMAGDVVTLHVPGQGLTPDGTVFIANTVATKDVVISNTDEVVIPDGFSDFMMIMRNGQFLSSERDYVKVANMITLNNKAGQEEVITFVSVQGSKPAELFRTKVDVLRTYIYDTEGTLTNIEVRGGVNKDESYEYNAEGMLVKQTVVQNETTFVREFIYDDEGNLIKETGDNMDDVVLDFYEVKPLEDSIANMETDVTTLKTRIQELEEELANMAVAPKMEKIKTSVSVGANSSLLVPIDVGMNKCRIENIYVKSTTGGLVSAEIYDTATLDFKVYYAYERPEIYDILNLPYQDDSGTTYVYLNVTNASDIQADMNIRLIVTELA